MKKSDLLLATKEANLLTQCSDAAKAVKPLRLNQELEFAIGNAFVWLSHAKWVFGVWMLSILTVMQ
jgi:hypothetical protein